MLPAHSAGYPFYGVYSVRNLNHGNNIKQNWREGVILSDSPLVFEWGYESTLCWHKEWGDEDTVSYDFCEKLGEA